MISEIINQGPPSENEFDKKHTRLIKGDDGIYVEFECRGKNEKGVQGDMMIYCEDCHNITWAKKIGVKHEL